ncbi:AIPR family protein [Labrys sp. LIt4]|uniref:AIPR family protein n=1 Tax=Labrys sp. LIt4 TaxID=2821355 RepID=UPI001ADFA494|nr:AIPR family protein [Labrys sp. LIt4]MBP0579591.1 AIPR family protein [Labrys sp. LIt4]
MEIDDFRQDLINQVAIWATADANFRHSAFVEVAVHYLEEAGEIADFEPCFFRGMGAKRRNLAVDGYAFDDADGSVRLLLAEPILGTEITTLTQTDARAAFGRLRAFVEEAIAGRLEADIDESHPAHGLASELRRRAPHLARIRAYILTDATLSTRARDWPEGEIANVPVEFHIWDIARLHRVHASRSGRDELVVDFGRVSGGGLPCVKAGTGGNQYTAYLCIVPGEVLAQIYDNHGSRLLEGNVRSFLSAKGRINKGIRNTAVQQPEMFFAYNNGIAATASAVIVTRTADGDRITSVTDLQIVNGGQTTASLAATRRADKVSLQGIFVPMKLSVVSPEKSGEMIPLIARYANSQNKVSDADFFSNHDYHRRLEQISRRIWAPALTGAQHETHWFYERARGQYLNEQAVLGPAERKRFLEMNPREQVITKTDLAKSENAWRQLPQIVSRGAQKNFIEFATFITERWEVAPDKFHEDYFRVAVARVMIFRATERLVSTQPWYSGGYRANVVAYTVARLAQLVASADGKAVDLLGVWQRQGLTAALSGQIERIACAMHGVIVEPPAGVQNVTEWCKRDLCWERAKQVSVEIKPEFLTELLDVSEVQATDRTARSQQRVDSGISAQATVVRLGRPYWSGVREWALARRLLAPDEERLVKVAAGLVQGLPTDKQSLRLLQIKARLESEGLAPVVEPA